MRVIYLIPFEFGDFAESYYMKIPAGNYGDFSRLSFRFYIFHDHLIILLFKFVLPNLLCHSTPALPFFS